MVPADNTVQYEAPKDRNILEISQHRASIAYSIKCVLKLIRYLHAAADFPVKEMWIAAIAKGWYITWPGLTVECVHKYLEPSEHTTMGHMKKIQMKIRPTSKNTVPYQHDVLIYLPILTYTPITQPTYNSPPRSVVHNVVVKVIPTEELTKELTNRIAIDQAGRNPVTSFEGDKYVTVMVDVDTGYINAAGISSRKAPQLVLGFQECYEELKSKGIIAQVVHLDNEILKSMIAEFKRQGLDYQPAAPGDHQVVDTERAIGIFKNHFIAIRSGTHPDFPGKGWSHLIRHAVVTMNILQPSKINPLISAYTQVHGIFDFNKTPLAPAGCKVIIHDCTVERPPWANHG